MKILTSEARTAIDTAIRTIADFPKPGIQFKDITTLLGNPEAFTLLMDHLQARYADYNLDYVAGIDARGFIFGSVLADRLNVGFVPIRKTGKLPYTTVAEKYSLEYGFDEVEVHIDAFGDNGKQPDGRPSRVLLIDDLLATGGTAAAATTLIGRLGAECVEACFLIELDFLKGKEKLNTTVYSVIV
jgi:adenine phosphoribosyltransferase